MHAEIAREWVERLRSGKYKQGKSYLKRGDEYCCLGVLCDMYAEATGTPWINADLAVGPVTHDFIDHENMALPRKVMRWAGMEIVEGASEGLLRDRVEATTRGPLQEVVRERYLTKLNDLGVDFPTIANVIEEHYDEL